ncbi:MAG TPA: ZIP family metal transporter [Candidatus Acidoferrales bacterium]
MEAEITHRMWISVGLGLTAAAANTLGGAIIVWRHWSREYLKYFIALGAGFMLATAMIEMLPESFRLVGERSMVLALVGYFLVHLFEHTLTPHFHFGEETHTEHVVAPAVSLSAWMGLAIHAFFDGVAIASGFIVSSWLGWVIFVAVFLHKIPEGFTLASLMVASGRSRSTGFFSALSLGVATLTGVLLMAWVRPAVSYGLPLSAGVAIYVAASDLMPEVNREPGVKMAVVVFIGLALLLLLKRLAPI